MPRLDRAPSALRLVYLIALSAAVVPAVGCADRLNISNTAGAEVGVLVDGHDGGGEVNDRGFLTSAATLEVSNLSAGVSNEVIGFTSQRPPRYVATPWTNALSNKCANARARSSIRKKKWAAGRN